MCVCVGKKEQAEVKAEHIIRERDESDAYELLQMQCDLLIARFQFVEREKELVEDVRGTHSQKPLDSETLNWDTYFKNLCRQSWS